MDPSWDGFFHHFLPAFGEYVTSFLFSKAPLRSKSKTPQTKKHHEKHQIFGILDV